MSTMTDLTDKTKFRSLEKKLLLYLLLTSSAITTILTAVLFYNDYKDELSSLDKTFHYLENTLTPSLTKSLWNIDDNQILSQLNGILNVPSMTRVQIINNDGQSIFELSDKDHHPDQLSTIKNYKLIFNENGHQEPLGTLIVTATKDDMYYRLRTKLVTIFLSQGLKTFLISFLLLMIVRKLVTNNLEDIFKYLENFDFAQTSSPQRFNYRNKPNSNYKDELDQLNEKINHFIDLLTEHNRASQQKLTEAQKKIEIQKMNAINSARLAALGEMAGGIAHEINNPLTIVSSSVNYLRRLYDGDKLSDDTFNKITTDIEQTLERITKIIKGLKNVSRDPNDFEPVEVSINEILAEVLGLCTERFKNHGINLLLDISPELEKEVIVCDRVQISQALINLLGNAFDALENCPAPWVKVQFEKDGTNSIIRISDNGDGISDEDIHKVFAPFYTSKAVGKGTGLGLSISKTILERHGGELRLDTNSEFTSFILTIPEINISDYEFNPFISPMRESELAPLS